MRDPLLHRCLVSCHAILLAVCGAVSADATPREVIAPRADPSPRLDGQLDDPCWQAGTWQSDFTDIAAPEQRVEPQTRFQFAYDDEYLYFAARLDEPQMDKLRAEITEHDGKLWTDDCLDLCLDPYGQGAEYRHFIINARGAWYDAMRDKGGKVAIASWDASPTIATRRGTDHWTVEMAIPLIELGLTPESKGRWGVQVGRGRTAGGTTQASSFAPMPGTFHKAADFATLRLPGAEIERFLVTPRRPTNARVVRDGQEITWIADTFLANHTGRFSFFQVEATLWRDGQLLGRQRQGIGLDHGQTTRLPLRVPIAVEAARGNADLTLAVFDAESPTIPHARLRMPVSVAYSPLTLIVSRPAYRQNIYATERVDHVEGIVRVHLAEARLAQTRLRMALATATNLIASVATETAFRLPAANLAEGDYELTAELFEEGGSTLGRAAARIRKLPPHDGELRLDEHRIPHLNGRPWLPFGWFSIPSGNRTWDGLYFPGEYAANAARGINAVMDYNTQFYPPNDIQSCLDEAQQAGLRLMFAPVPDPAMQSEEAMKLPLRADEADRIRAHVRRWKNHPALLGWYMGDEIEAIPALVERMEAIYQIVRDEDPFHPCVLLNNTIEGMHQYANACDVLMPDPYPLFTEGTIAARGIKYLGKFIKEIPRIDGGRLGAWITPEGFNYGDFGQPRGRVPNFTELRCQVYQAVVDGATGFLWYSYWYTQPYPETVEGIPWLAREAATLQPAILAPRPHHKLSVLPARAPIETSYRVVGSQAWLLAVNPTGERHDVAIALPPGAPTRWYVVSEGRTVEATDGEIRDRFDGCATHIYTTDRDRAQRQSIAEAEQAIAAAKAARLATGNLALLDTGATATASSSVGFYLPHMAINGTLMGMHWTSQNWKKLPEWLEVKFPTPKVLSRVRVSARNVVAAEVHVADNEEWKRVAGLQAGTADWLVAEFDPVRTAAFRIVITQASGSPPSVREVEAYEQ